MPSTTQLSQTRERAAPDGHQLAAGCEPSGLPVALVIASTLYREGLARILNNSPGTHLAAAAADVDSLNILPLAPEPAVVLLDGTLARRDYQVSFIKACWPDARVVVLTAAGSDSEVLAWTRSGVSGLVSENSTVDELIEALLAVAQGSTVCAGSAAAALFRELASPQSATGGVRGADVLTPREFEITRLIDDGLSNKEIARALSISLSTVKNHIHNVFSKLELDRRMAAAAWIRSLKNFPPTAA